MRTLILVIAFMVSGCIDTDNNHGYGYEIDGVTTLGIEYSGYTISGYDLDKEFNSVYQCITDQWREPLNNNYNGYAFYIDLMVFSVYQIEDTNSQGRYYGDLIAILDKDSPYYNDHSIYVYRHELVHYILDQLTGNKHGSHQSNFFYSCVYF